MQEKSTISKRSPVGAIYLAKLPKNLQGVYTKFLTLPIFIYYNIIDNQS